MSVRETDGSQRHLYGIASFLSREGVMQLRPRTELEAARFSRGGSAEMPVKETEEAEERGYPRRTEPWEQGEETVLRRTCQEYKTLRSQER